MKKINVEKIIAISGTPGLFKIINNGNKGVIVENIIDKKRTIVLNNNKIFSLDTIRIFIDEGELPLAEALYQLYECLNHTAAPHHKTSTDEEIKTLFEKAIPNYDKEKVNINNMRKLMQWYNQLHQANMLEVITDENENTDAADSISQESFSENKNTEAIEKLPKQKKSNTKKSKKETDPIEQSSADTENTPKKRGRKKKSENE